ncbi:MAG: hypothetical protein HY318_08630 [Armatimonadetes bacterium]|nr:hypothetical protein [Armatimonadota bacterium]
MHGRLDIQDILFMMECLFIWYCVVAFHEAAHVVAGLWVGFRFESISVGPLRIYRDGDCFRVGTSADTFPFNGSALCFPEDTRDLRRRLTAMILAGPVADFSLALLSCLWLLSRRLLHLGGENLSTAEASVVYPLVAMSIFILVSNDIGVLFNFGRPSSSKFDLIRALRIVGRSKESDNECAAVVLLAALLKDRHIRRIDPGLVERAATLYTEGEDDHSRLWLAYYSDLITEKIHLAEEHLSQWMQLSDRLPRDKRIALLTEAAYYTVTYKHDIAGARALWQQAEDLAANPTEA